MAFEGHGTHLMIEGLHKSFGSNPVLEGIDLEITPGEFVAIVGRSGCGKSTLLRLIAGLDSANGGSIYLDGKRSYRLNSIVCMMFQDARLLPWEKVQSNVELGLFGAQSDTKEKSLQLLQEVGLRGQALPLLILV